MFLLSVLVAVPVAVIAALNQNRLIDQIIRVFFTVTLSLPGFWLGLILLILGLVLGVGILYTIGIVLIIVGAILWLLGSMDRAVGGRRHYW